MLLLLNIKNLEAEIILCPAGAYFRESVPSKSIEIESWTAVKFSKWKRHLFVQTSSFRNIVPKKSVIGMIHKFFSDFISRKHSG